MIVKMKMSQEMIDFFKNTGTRIDVSANNPTEEIDFDSFLHMPNWFKLCANGDIFMYSPWELPREIDEMSNQVQELVIARGKENDQSTHTQSESQLPQTL